MASEYGQIRDKEIEDRVRLKYQESIDELKALNFEELCFFGESMQAMGLSNGPLGLLGVIAALPNEVSRIGRDLSATTFFLLLVSREYDTYVSSFGLGTKFYTSFMDGTFVITANFDTAPIHDDEEKLYKFVQLSSIEGAWHAHRTRVDEFIAKGKQRNYHLSFDEFARLACREDTYMLKPKALAGAIFGGARQTVVGMAVFVCLLFVVLTLLLSLIPNGHSPHPAGW